MPKRETENRKRDKNRETQTSPRTGWHAKRNGGALAESTGLPDAPPSLPVRGEAPAVGEKRFLVGKLYPLAAELREGEHGGGVLGEVGADEDGVVVGDGDEAAVEGTVEVGAECDAVFFPL